MKNSQNLLLALSVLCALAATLLQKLAEKTVVLKPQSPASSSNHSLEKENHPSLPKALPRSTGMQGDFQKISATELYRIYDYFSSHEVSNSEKTKYAKKLAQHTHKRTAQDLILAALVLNDMLKEATEFAEETLYAYTKPQSDLGLFVSLSLLTPSNSSRKTTTEQIEVIKEYYSQFPKTDFNRQLVQNLESSEKRPLDLGSAIYEEIEKLKDNEASHDEYES
jgi:hypothetical protein